MYTWFGMCHNGTRIHCNTSWKEIDKELKFTKHINVIIIKKCARELNGLQRQSKLLKCLIFLDVVIKEPDVW